MFWPFCFLKWLLNWIQDALYKFVLPWYCSIRWIKILAELFLFLHNCCFQRPPLNVTLLLWNLNPISSRCVATPLSPSFLDQNFQKKCRSIELYHKRNCVKHTSVRISTFFGESNIETRNISKQCANIPNTFSTMHLALLRW